VGITSWIIIGLIAGWSAGIVLKGGGYGVVGDIALGIIGAILGGFLASTYLGMNLLGYNVISFVSAGVGAAVGVLAGRMFVNWRRSPL